MARTVNEVMTPDPRTVEPGAPLTEVAKQMDQADAGAVIVAEDGRFKGILTDRDIVIRAIAADKDPKSTTAGDIATTGAKTIGPEDSIEDAIQLMRDQAIRRLPVVEGDRPVGIVSLGDLAIEGEGEQVLDDISSAPSNN